MKIQVFAANNSDNELQMFIDSLEDEAYSKGYELANQDGSGNLIFVAREDKDLMPTVVAEKETFDGEIYFTPTMKFPESISTDDVDYADSFEYYIGKWMNAAKLCTYLLKNHYTAGMYED